MELSGSLAYCRIENLLSSSNSLSPILPPNARPSDRGFALASTVLVHCFLNSRPHVLSDSECQITLLQVQTSCRNIPHAQLHVAARGSSHADAVYARWRRRRVPLASTVFR